MVPDRLRSELPKRLARRLPFEVIEAGLFPNEASWLRFGRKRPGEPDPSVILFTLHKVASTFTHELLGYLNAELLGLKRMDWDRYIHNRFPEDTTTWISREVDELFDPVGYAYGPFRAPLPIPDLDRYRILLILRDPRDILTSAYFSEAFSHAPPLLPERLAEFEERRERVRKSTIDDFVLERAGDLLSIFDEYKTLAERYDVRPLVYEQMMGNWEVFMDSVEAAIGVEIPQEHRDILRSKGRIDDELDGEVTNHLRQGTPGDHADKLQPETIEQLNKIFTAHLAWLAEAA